MDAISRVRAASHKSIDDVFPLQLREIITNQINGESPKFGLATIIISEEVASSNEEVSAVNRKAAGVQLIYEGLRLTQDLVRGNRWKEEEQKLNTDMDLLAADVMVAKGFHLLSHTKAANKAVETIRSFGIEETQHNSSSKHKSSPSHMGLERDIFELAIIAGYISPEIEIPKNFNTKKLLNLDLSPTSRDYLVALLRTIEEEEDFLLGISNS
tara:strand:- start:23493 stop:24131 length:639 start_codon:yes stop_codon:yes gene_type:complete